ncbi:major facilitator superfamily domain-containing protein 12-like [Artemia franciscana]|uniref:major facilitator superfamily domain-containing protein 12-like n=1 Tax=Artemia franciscana TaxID=6661 RepID=UPI0032DA6C3B
MKSASSNDFHQEKSQVKLKIKICYSVGHVLNDFCSSLWFTYLLVYFQYVLNMESTQAGTLLLIGQIIDGLTTPLVGLGKGKGKGKALCCGRPYKGWHIIGAICTILGFPALFLPCYGCEKYGQWGILLWYGTFVALAQIGWAIVQISHMALIPILAKTNNQRIEISSYKNATGFVASIAVYCIA